MIVFIGDWIKFSGKWRQVINVDPVADMFATLGDQDDGSVTWWGTDNPELFEGHLSDLELQEKIEA